MNRKELADRLIREVAAYRDAKASGHPLLATIVQATVGLLVLHHAVDVISALEWWDKSKEVVKEAAEEAA